MPQLKLAVRESSTFVAFLTPNYFQSAWCCLEICEAVQHDVPIIFVVHDGSQWGGRTFPQLTDVPQEVVVHATDDVVVRPRDAFAVVEKTAPRIEHARSYFSEFTDKLKAGLGAPPAVADLEGEAKTIWRAAGGGAAMHWGKLQAQLKEHGGASFAAASTPRRLRERSIGQGRVVSDKNWCQKYSYS